MLHVDLERLEDPFRKALESFRRQEAVIFLENGVPVGTLVFLSSSPPAPTGDSGEQPPNGVGRRRVRTPSGAPCRRSRVSRPRR